MRNTDFGMQLKQVEYPVKVAKIVDRTIRAVYSHYYLSGGSTVFSGSA